MPLSLEEWLRRAEELQRQGNPFVDAINQEIPLEPITGAKKYTRAAVRGATLGVLNQDDPQDLGTMATEFVAGIPSTMAATALTAGALGPVVGAARMAKLAPAAKQVLTSGVIGAGVGAAKTIATGDASHLISDPTWWMLGEIGGLGMGKGYRKLAAKLRAAKPIGPEDIPITATPNVGAPRNVGTNLVTGQEYGIPPTQVTTPAVAQLRKSPLYQAAQKIKGEEPPGTQNIKLRPVEPEIPPTAIPEEVLGPPRPQTLRPASSALESTLSPFETSSAAGMVPEEPILGPVNPLSKQLGEVERSLQATNAQKQLDDSLSPTLLEPTQVEKFPPPPPSPKGFYEPDTPGGPAPKFVKSAGRPRTMGEFGEVVDDYGPFRRLDEFGIEDYQDSPDLNYFSKHPFEQPGTPKLLSVDQDPLTGVKNYTPLDEMTDSKIKIANLAHREIEPSLDTFQRDALANQGNVSLLDVKPAKDKLTTSKMLELSDTELQNLTDNPNFVTNPHTFFTVTDKQRAKEIKGFIKKVRLSEEDVTDMERDVETLYRQVINEPINKNLPPEELKRTRQDIWYRLLAKRIPPC